MLFLVSAVLLSCSSTFAMGSDAPADAAPAKKQHSQRQQKQRRPRFKMSEEQKTQMKLFKETVDAYKKEQSPENKAKLVDLLSKNFDKRIDAMEKRAQSMKKNAADLEKKAAELKANKHFSSLIK